MRVTCPYRPRNGRRRVVVHSFGRVNGSGAECPELDSMCYNYENALKIKKILVSEKIIGIFSTD